MNRCRWCSEDLLYQKYHDDEWGVPVYDDTKLFEFLTLEGAQAGLSWLTVLKKREGYIRAFESFDINIVSNYSDDKIEALLKDSNIIRNRLKIKSVVKNAQGILKIQKEFGSFSEYLWQYVDNQPLINHFSVQTDVPSETALSKKISKDLKKRGFSFVGPTIIYAYMQAIGIVNDHITSCFKYQALDC